MQNLTQIAAATVEVVKSKQAVLDVSAVAASAGTVLGMTKSEWMAIGAGVLLVMRLGLTGLEILERLRGRGKGTQK